MSSRDHLFIPSPNTLPLSCVYLTRFAGFTRDDFYNVHMGDCSLRTSAEWHDLYKKYHGEVVKHAKGWLTSDIPNPVIYWGNVPITAHEYRSRVAKSTVDVSENNRKCM